MSGWGSRAIRDKLKRKRCPPGILSQQQGASARLSFLSVFYSANFHYGAPRTCAVPAGLWSKINRVSIFHHLFLLKFAFFLFLSLVLISSPPPSLSLCLSTTCVTRTRQQVEVFKNSEEEFPFIRTALGFLFDALDFIF